MARDLTCPAAGDKVGLKIDYMAKRLGAALAPLGFKRKGRNLLREAAEGLDRHWQIVNLQAGERNAGASGCCYVNLALQFPAIQRTLAARSDRAWLLDELDKVDEVYGQLRERLQNLMPDGHRLAGSEITVRADEDLDALAAALIEAMAQHGLPWLTRHATVAAVRDVDAGLLTADVDVRLAAALTLGDVAGAERLLQAHPRRFERVMPSYVEALRRWLEAAGVNCAALPAPGTAPVKDSWTLRREAAEAAEDARHAAQAAALASRIDGEQLDPDLLAAAWIAEWRARWRDEPAPLTDLPSGARVAALAAPERESVLLALLQTLVPLEAQARRDPLRPHAGEFEPDEAVAVLLQALLLRLEAPGQVAALFERLLALQTRLLQDLVTARYPWGFACLAQWLVKQPQDATLRREMQAWLQALATLMPARFDAVTQALAAWHSRPLEPAAPGHATQLELRAVYQAETAAQDPAATRVRIAAYPEQSLAADDKAAVQAWRRWLQRDPATGRLAVACEADDWGGPATQAWQQAAPGLREALTPVLQAWLEGVEVKPRALTAIRQQVAALPTELGERWRAWVLERLRAFEFTDGATEWATTRMRPGVGAVLGEGSENLLTGLLLWSWADPALPAEALAPVWSSLTQAAWRRLPNHGARAPGVGRLGLRLLAGLGGPERDFVQAWAGAGDEKQRAKSATQALTDPLSRP